MIFEVKEIKDIADKYQKNPAQVVLRWSLQMGFLPLPKSVTTDRMEANMEIFDFDFELSQDYLANLTGKVGQSKDPDSGPF